MTPPRTRPRKGSRAKSFFIGLLIGLVCAVAAYFIGQGKGNAGLAAAQNRAATAEKQVIELEATNDLLQSRALLSRAAADLERRNFGTASTDLQSAATALATIPPTASVDQDRIGALRKEIEEVSINVSEDVGRQRTRLLGLAAQIDTLLPAPSASAPAETPPAEAGAPVAPSDATNP